MRLLISLVMLLTAQSALADMLVPVRTIRAKELITHADLTVKKGEAAGAVSNLRDVVGKEARVSLYAGRPIQSGDIGPPAIVDRNQIVFVRFSRGGLNISTEARALNRAAVGEIVRVMNINSRATLSGIVAEDGTIRVK